MGISSLASVVLALLLLPCHVDAHSCNNGQRVTCMNVQSTAGAPSTYGDGYSAQGSPLCTPEGDKVFCLVDHDYHRCGADQVPCCEDGSKPQHSGYADGPSGNSEITCTPTTTTLAPTQPRVTQPRLTEPAATELAATKPEQKEAVVAKLEEAATPKESTLSWILGEIDEDCSTTCTQAGRNCDEEAWPTSQEEWSAVVPQTEGLQCRSHQRGTWAFNPAICINPGGPLDDGCSGTCFWEGTGSRCEGGTGTHPSPIARRICPCRASVSETIKSQDEGESTQKEVVDVSESETETEPDQNENIDKADESIKSEVGKESHAGEADESIQSEVGKESHADEATEPPVTVSDPKERADVSLMMKVRLRHGSTEADVLAELKEHKITLTTTVEAHFGYQSVQVLDIIIAGRRLGAGDHGVAKLSVALRVFGTPRMNSLDIGQALHKAFTDAGAILHIESAAMQWTTEPINSPTDTAKIGKSTDEGSHFWPIVVICIGIAAALVLPAACVLLLRRLNRKRAASKNAEMSAVGPSVAQDIESVTTKDIKVKDETHKWESESESTATPSSHSASDEGCNSECVMMPSSTQDVA